MHSAIPIALPAAQEQARLGEVFGEACRIPLPDPHLYGLSATCPDNFFAAPAAGVGM